MHIPLADNASGLCVRKDTGTAMRSEKRIFFFVSQPTRNLPMTRSSSAPSARVIAFPDG